LTGFFLLSFLGCLLGAAPQEKTGVWLDVPYVKQSENGCGSAAIAMVLQYWNAHGRHVASELADALIIQRSLYSRKVRGIYASDMQTYFKTAGFQVFPINGEWSDLREHLTLGRPVIVSLQLGGTKSPLHYVVVVGLDWQNGAVFLNDPARGKLLRVERTEFEKQWQSNRNWMLVALPEKFA
jgi:ABC-type bacteriocin/lantibiotic exporter with double-glycine peptidase domain